MKIRNGFVSNSSSSSFIMIGVDSKLLKTPYEDEETQSLYVELNGIDELIGFIIDDWSDEDYFESGNLTVQEINQKADELSRKLNVDFSDIKLYYGTRPS